MTDPVLARAEAALAAGDLADALAAWEAVQEARLDERLRYRWALVLVEAGALGEAAALLPGLSDPDLAFRLRAVLGPEALPGPGPDGAPGEPSDGPPAEPEDDEDDPLGADVAVARDTPADAEAVAAFLRWFGGRRDLYARQWYDERRRRGGYRPVREPLTEAVVRAHLAGRHTVGQYLLYPDATVSFAAIDLDLSASALAELRAGEGDEAGALSHEGLRRYARALMSAAAGLGLRLFPEDSGGRGLHLWIFFEPRRTARAARALLGQVVAAVPQAPEVGVEVFPKQERLGPRGLSSLVKLPLGLHQASLRRCRLLDDDLRPLDDPGEALVRLEAANPQVVDAVLGRRLVPLPTPELDPVEPPPPLPEAYSARSLAEALRAVPSHEAKAACERMVEGCGVLGALARKALERRRLTPEEARALVFSVGLVGAGPGLADELLAAAGASFKELERVRRGLQSPVGCKRLRRLAPDGGAGCRCPVGADARPYPTPALLAVGEVAPAAPRWRPFAPWLEEDRPAVQDPLEAIGEALRRIDARLSRLEDGEG